MGLDQEDGEREGVGGWGWVCYVCCNNSDYECLFFPSTTEVGRIVSSKYRIILGSIVVVVVVNFSSVDI